MHSEPAPQVQPIELRIASAHILQLTPASKELIALLIALPHQAQKIASIGDEW